LALEQILKIESLGGALKAIEQGWQQREIHNAAYQHLNDVESESRLIVGVNHGLMEDDTVTEVLKLDPTVGDEQCRRLAELRSTRNAELVAECLANVRNAAQSGDNLFPHVLHAVKHDCTLGEIIQAMKDVFGTWMAPSGF
jgi:methylmalonyl-CoA mutase N-terminal domain/subunit